MPEFLELIPPNEALKILLSNITHPIQSEWVETSQALGRVTFNSIQAPHPLPSFNRSTVDGFAVRAEDTFGASETLPTYLIETGEVKMGVPATLQLNPGQCALIHTGGMLPPGSNAVVMVEHTQRAGEREIEVLRAVASGENVLKEGEDISSGQVFLPAGKQIRPVEIGSLAALGINRVLVACHPRVAILSSGDEIVPPDAEIRTGQVRDVNTSTLKALVHQNGGLPIPYGILPDRLEALAKTASFALKECDLVVFTAGSSTSVRDMTADVINGLGKPGILVHGVNVRPGKPTILAACQPEGSPQSKPIIGLPGNPVSAFVIANLFVVPVIHLMLGLPVQAIKPTVLAKLSINVPSQAGREDWIAVKLVRSEERWMAEPVFGKSNFIISLSRADGLVRIPPSATGLNAGEQVEVVLI